LDDNLETTNLYSQKKGRPITNNSTESIRKRSHSTYQKNQSPQTAAELVIFIESLEATKQEALQQLQLFHEKENETDPIMSWNVSQMTEASEDNVAVVSNNSKISKQDKNRNKVARTSKEKNNDQSPQKKSLLRNHLHANHLHAPVQEKGHRKILTQLSDDDDDYIMSKTSQIQTSILKMYLIPNLTMMV
jgi:hypothetical protein